MKLLWLEGQPPPGRGRSTNTPRLDSSCTSPSCLCSLGSDPHLHIHAHTLWRAVVFARERRSGGPTPTKPSQAGPSQQRQQQRRWDLKRLAGMKSPERLITDITTAACSAVCQRVCVCLFPILIPACVSICERPGFAGKRADGGGCGPRRDRLESLRLPPQP